VTIYQQIKYHTAALESCKRILNARPAEPSQIDVGHSRRGRIGVGREKAVVWIGPIAVDDFETQMVNIMFLILNVSWQRQEGKVRKWRNRRFFWILKKPAA
jgi:hypothetical protein